MFTDCTKQHAGCGGVIKSNQMEHVKEFIQKEIELCEKYIKDYRQHIADGMTLSHATEWKLETALQCEEKLRVLNRLVKFDNQYKLKQYIEDVRGQIIKSFKSGYLRSNSTNKYANCISEDMNLANGQLVSILERAHKLLTK